MSELLDIRIYDIFKRFEVEGDCFINENITIAHNPDKIRFRRTKVVKGIVIIGSKYPLSGKDIDMETHLKFLDYVDNIDYHGVVFDDLRGAGMKYMRGKGKVNLLII